MIFPQDLVGVPWKKYLNIFKGMTRRPNDLPVSSTSERFRPIWIFPQWGVRLELLSSHDTIKSYPYRKSSSPCIMCTPYPHPSTLSLHTPAPAAPCEIHRPRSLFRGSWGGAMAFDLWCLLAECRSLYFSSFPHSKAWGGSSVRDPLPVLHIWIHRPSLLGFFTQSCHEATATLHHTIPHPMIFLSPMYLTKYITLY